MGTSSSSSGPKGKVGLIPAWTPPLPSPNNGIANSGTGSPLNGDGLSNGSGSPTIPALPNMPSIGSLAPERRFMSARTHLGKYAQSGSRDDLKKGLGNYVKKGLGGNKLATRRMSKTAVAAVSLVQVLNSLSANQPLPSNLAVVLDPQGLQGQSVKEIADRISNAIHPSDGSQDAEAGREALSHAISDLLEKEPTTDLLHMNEDQILFVTKTYIAYDLCHRIELDVFKSMLDKVDHATASQRLEDMTDFVKACVSESLKKEITAGNKIDQNTISLMATKIINNTLIVFEEWA